MSERLWELQAAENLLLRTGALVPPVEVRDVRRPGRTTDGEHPVVFVHLSDGDHIALSANSFKDEYERIRSDQNRERSTTRMRLQLPFQIDDNQRSLLLTYGYEVDGQVHLPFAATSETVDTEQPSTQGAWFSRPVTVVMSL